MPAQGYRPRWLAALFSALAVVLGGLHAWFARHDVVFDAISYLDIGDAYLRGDWTGVVNGYWSPLYPALLALGMLALKPSPYWEFAAAHLVNFAIFLFALGSFCFMWLELGRHQRHLTESAGAVTFPEWAWVALGHGLFLWSSLDLVTLAKVSPDMCVSALAYLAAGIVLRIRRWLSSWRAFVLLGLVLGCGYLGKTALLPLALVFLVASAFSAATPARGTAGALLALATLLVVVSPYAAALSRTKGRLTVGDSGKLNYAWYVNGMVSHVHWQGEPPGTGIPRHPTRQISSEPAIYEFGAPIGGTYPPWYDPSYWYEGVRLRFDLREQIRALAGNGLELVPIVSGPQSLLVGFLILFLMSEPWSFVRNVGEQWSLPAVAVAGTAMYALVYVEGRYVAPFVVMLWAGLLSGVRLPKSEQSRRLVACVSAAVLVTILAGIGASTLRVVARATGDHLHWRVASGLGQLGVQAGDRVAFIGNAFQAHWARLARVRIVAEMPGRDASGFWAADDRVRSRIIETFAGTGAAVVVVQLRSDYGSPAGWRRIGGTDYHAYLLR